MTDYRYNARLARYQDARTGRIVKPPAVRDAVDSVIAGSSARLARLASQLSAGRLTVDAWQAQTAQEIKILHLAQLAAGAGGWAQLTPADFGTVGATLRAEYAFLAQLSARYAAGAVSPAQLRASVRRYAMSAIKTYEGAVLRADRAAGYRFEHNELHAVQTEHCTQCLQLTALGEVPVGMLPLVGTRQCRGDDHCRVVRTKEAIHAAA